MKFKKVQLYLNNFFWLFLTYSLAPYFYFRIFLRRKKKGEQFKILIIYTAKIGDLVCATPVFREIKKRFPSSYLTALVVSHTKDILKNNPRINKVVLITDYASIGGKLRLLSRLRKEKYDWAFNLLPGSFNNIIPFWSCVPHRVVTTHGRSGEITGLLSLSNNYRLEYKNYTSVVKHYLNLLKFIGIKETSEEKEIFIQPEEEKKALNFLRQNNLSTNDLLIGISVSPGNKFKQWGQEKYANLADQLVKKLNAKVIFTGTANDRIHIENVKKMMQNDSINSSGYFKLHELPAFFKKLKLFISVDSGPVYLADAVGTPVIDIGGFYDVREQAPSGSKSKVLQKFPVSCPFLAPITPACEKECLKYLGEITPKEVFKAAIALIGINQL